MTKDAIQAEINRLKKIKSDAFFSGKAEVYTSFKKKIAVSKNADADFKVRKLVKGGYLLIDIIGKKYYCARLDDIVQLGMDILRYGELIMQVSSDMSLDSVYDLSSIYK